MIIHIEKFGKIKKADIKVSPLTLFIGDNNTGKSYLLSLIWALYSLGSFPVIWSGARNIVESSSFFYKIADMLRQKDTMPVSDEFQVDDILDIFNKALEKNKDGFVSAIFNYPMNIGKLSLKEEEEKVIHISITYNQKLQGTDTSHDKEYTLSVESNTFRFRYSLQQSEITSRKLVFETRFIIEVIVSSLINKKLELSEAIYFPSSRTGFMLSKNIINSVSHKQTFDNFSINGKEEPLKVEPFTKPIMNFLDFLETDFSAAPNDNYKNIAEKIEHELVHGKFVHSRDGQKDIKYIPDGADAALPLRAASAVVTELAPFMMLLQKKRSPYSLLCYEEPEMCLHAKLQLKMGQLLIRLVHSGVKVIATTHSDIILQYINNIGVLEAHSKNNKIKEPYKKIMQKYNLCPENLISFKDVAVYELHDCGAHSEVTKIEPSSYGFHSKTFINALSAALKQSSTIDKLNDED